MRLITLEPLFVGATALTLLLVLCFLIGAVADYFLPKHVSEDTSRIWLGAILLMVGIIVVAAAYIIGLVVLELR